MSAPTQGVTTLEAELRSAHAARRTGVLLFDVASPLSVRFRAGEVIGGGILDFIGFDALGTVSLRGEPGRASFRSIEPGEPILHRPFELLLDQWARANEEWARIRTQLDSPSRVLSTTPTAGPSYALYAPGRSVRATAKAAGVPVAVAANMAWQGLKTGELRREERFAWFGLRLRAPGITPATGYTRPGHATLSGARRGMDARLLTGCLDGSMNMGELVDEGFDAPVIRAYLIAAIRRGEFSAPGSGWLLRDLTWERQGCTDRGLDVS